MAENFFSKLISSYQDFKFDSSDAVCETIGPWSITPEGFDTYCTRFMDGSFITLELLLISSILALLLAIPIALARVSKVRALSLTAYGYIYVFRGTPLLIQLFILYYGIGSVGAEKLGALWIIFKDGYWVGMIALMLNSAAYIAEILRGGIVNVDRGQYEASEALALSWWQSMRKVILPQAFKSAWPAYSNEVVLLLKGSALVSTITVMDLMGQTRAVFAKSYSLDIYLYATVLYLILAGIITLLYRMLEKSLFKTA